MEEGYSEENSEEPSHSPEQDDDSLGSMYDTVERIVKNIADGHVRTVDDLEKDAWLALRIRIAVEDRTPEELGMRTSTLCNLFDSTAQILKQHGLPSFAEWFWDQIREIDPSFPVPEKYVPDSDPELELEEPKVMDVVPAPPNSNHLLDISGL